MAEQLDVPDIPEQGLPDSDDLTYFAHDDAWVEKSIGRIEVVHDSLDRAARGDAPDPSLKPSRYRDQLPSLSASRTAPLRERLRVYLDGLRAV
jgi:hypothetical protein